MAIAPIKSPGWVQGDLLTPTELNDFQAKLIGAGTGIDAVNVRVDNAATLAIAQAVALGELDTRVDLLEDQSTRPDRWWRLHEDFHGARYEASPGRIYASQLWLVGGTPGSITGLSGGPGNPGVLYTTLAGDGTNKSTYFHLLSPGVEMIQVSQIREATFVFKVNDDINNANTAVRIGFVTDNSLLNGGANALTVYWQNTLGETNYYLGRQNAGSGAAGILLGTQGLNKFVTIRFVKHPTTSALQVFFGASATASATVTVAQMPAGYLGVGAFQNVTTFDNYPLYVSWDLIDALGYLGSGSPRHEA